MIGATITMYAAVSQRQKEIGVLRAIGFSRLGIMTSFLLESLVLALGGGLLGGLAALGMGTVYPAIMQRLRQSKYETARREYLTNLKEKYHAKIYLEKPLSYVKNLGLDYGGEKGVNAEFLDGIEGLKLAGARAAGRCRWRSRWTGWRCRRPGWPRPARRAAPTAGPMRTTWPPWPVIVTARVRRAAFSTRTLAPDM